jgi:hypothetical protein
VAVHLQDLFNKSYYPKLEDHQQINKPWYIVDAEVRRSPVTHTLVCSAGGHVGGQGTCVGNWLLARDPPVHKVGRARGCTAGVDV